MSTIVTVQNRYNLTDRDSEDVLEACEARRHRLHPLVPAGHRRRWPSPAARSTRSPRAHDATPAQVALAWLLQRSPIMLPIPGTGSVEHLEENLAAADLTLSDEEMERIGQSA